MKNEFASANLTMGQLNAIVKKLGGHERALRLLCDELVVKEKNEGLWYEGYDIIYTQVITDGTIGGQWFERLRAGGFRIGFDDDSFQILTHSLFIPTNRVVVKVAILKGILFTDKERTISTIRAEAKKRNLLIPGAELACYLREKFSDKALEAMGLSSILIMHNPFELHEVKRPYVLEVDSGGIGNHLIATVADEGRKWNGDTGFAFVVSQTPS